MPKPIVWTPDRDATLKTMSQAGFSPRQIGAAVKIGYVTVIKRLKELGAYSSPSERRPQEVDTPLDHRQVHARVRRGFHVPPQLHAQYVDLLKSGISIEDARQRLGLERD